MNKVQSSKFKVQNLMITALVIILLCVAGLSMVSMVNAQAPDRDIPASDNGTVVPTQSDVRVTAPEKQSDVRVTAPQSDVRVTAPKDSGIFTLSNPLKVNSIGELLHSLVQVFTYLVILFAVIMFVYLGFQYVAFAAQGNSGKIGELHTKFMWLVAGVAIVIGARVIIEVIINTLSATGTVSPDVIQSAQNALKK